MSTLETTGRAAIKFASLALIAALAVAGCQQETPTPVAPSPDAKPGLSLAGGRLVLPAVKGNPGAAYFELTNGGTGETSLAALVIAGAGKSEMHETSGGSMARLASVALQPGETVRFAPGGKHVMVFDLDPKVTAGSTAELTLTFGDGDKLSAPLRVDAAGGMIHGDKR